MSWRLELLVGIRIQLFRRVADRFAGLLRAYGVSVTSPGGRCYVAVLSGQYHLAVADG